MNEHFPKATGGNDAGSERAPTELLDVKAVSALGVGSPRHIYRLSKTGRMPRPVKIGALVRWRRREILDWIAAGCPNLRRAGR